MPTRLSKSPERLFIDVLLSDTNSGGWDPSGAVGYDLDDVPGDEGFLPVGTSLDDVGETHPHITVQRSNESSGGETTYDFVTTKGPGQQRDGQLVVTARAEEVEDGYTGDSVSHGAVDAEALVETLIDEVEDVCLRNAQGGSTGFSYLGSQRGADAPNDYDATPPVMIEQCTVAYGWDRAP